MQYEEMLLGQMLTDNNIINKIKLSEDDFLSATNRKYYSAIQECLDQGIAADIITVGSKFPNPYEVSQLTDNIGSVANWRFYESEIKRASVKRKLYHLADEVKNGLTDHSPEDMIEQIEATMTDITKDFTINNSYSFKESMPEFIEELQRRYNTKDKLPGIRTGLPRLDDYILGFQKKFLYYIGARPSGGKSAILLNMALHAMLKEKKTVGIISAESSLHEILTRSFAQEGKINSMNLLSGNYDTRTFREFDTLLELFSTANGYVCDEPNISLQFLKREIRKMVRVEKCEIIFVDYVQLITNEKIEKTTPRVTETSMALKMLARELNIPIVCAAQLRRDTDNRRPTLSDFSDSSQIEKDADIAMLIYHKEVDESYLLIEKARDGRTGGLPVFFKKEYVRFFEKEGGCIG